MISVREYKSGAIEFENIKCTNKIGVKLKGNGSIYAPVIAQLILFNFCLALKLYVKPIDLKKFVSS